MVRLAGVAILVFFAFTPGCKGQSTYEVSNSIDTSLLNYDKLFDSKTKAGDSKEKSVRELYNRMKDNIAAIYVYENDSLHKLDRNGVISNYIPAGVQNFYYDDTLRITAGIGFFAGAGVNINISGNQFTSQYGEGSDGEGYLKYKPDDSMYINSIEVEPVMQRLTLNKIATFKNGETLIGEYEGAFKPFYDNSNHENRVRKVKWKVIFKCTVRNVDELRSKKVNQGN